MSIINLKKDFKEIIWWRRYFYTVPYCNLFELETEYLISNPNDGYVTGTLYIWGKNCEIVYGEKLEIGPHCTKVFRIPSDIPADLQDSVLKHTGFALLIVTEPLMTHILYYSSKNKLVGEELVGTKDIMPTKGYTYAFGYRTDTDLANLGAALFVSNLYQDENEIKIGLLQQNCSLQDSKTFQMKPYCTGKFDLPAGFYGYGRIESKFPILVNILHLCEDEVASAELIGKTHRIDGPAIVKGK